jgi:hypothetical protein
MTNSAEEIEHPDHYQYSWVMFYRDTIEFFVSSVKYYEELLVSEKSLIDEDQHLSSFLSEDVRREFKIGRTLEEATRVRIWLELQLNEHPDRFDVDVSLTHGNVRYLKSVGTLYLGFLKQRRNKLSTNPNCTNNLLTALDRRITAQDEALNNMGVFKNASLIPLVIDQNTVDISLADAETNFDSISKVSRPKPQVFSTIEILDSELRRRCLDLFKQFEENGQSDRHDTVIAEATRILENRLRTLTRTTDGAAALAIVTRAFDKENPILKVSKINGEQEAAQLLFRGVFGFIRNQFQHKLISDITPERVLQILGFIDYLISIINTANPIELNDNVRES